MGGRFTKQSLFLLGYFPQTSELSRARVQALMTHCLINVTLYQTGSGIEFNLLVSKCPQVLFVDIKTYE